MKCPIHGPYKPECPTCLKSKDQSARAKKGREILKKKLGKKGFKALMTRISHTRTS